MPFLLKAFKIDDMNEFTDHPVVLLSHKKSFFSLGSMRTIVSTFFEYLIIEITPVAAKIDISFDIGMISLFKFEDKKSFTQKVNFSRVLNVPY